MLRTIITALITAISVFWLKAESPQTCPSYTITTTNITCAGNATGRINITAPNGTQCTYTWNGPSSGTRPSSSGIAITGLLAGTFSISVDNGSSVCTETVVLTQPSLITGPAQICPGSATNISVPNGSAYSWNLPDGSTLTTQTIAATAIGTYSVTVNLGGGCIATGGRVMNQSADITSSSINGGSGTVTVCPGSTITLGAAVNDLPAGSTVAWYHSTSQGFDPATQGTLMNTTPIPPGACPAACPDLLSIFIDACNGTGNEEDNEFMVLATGSGFNVNDLIVDYNASNNNNLTNNDINVAAGQCGYQIPQTSLINNLRQGSCNGFNIIPAGPGDFVPGGALVFLFTSSNVTSIYDLTDLCSQGKTIYVLQSSCSRISGAFTNSEPANCLTATNRFHTTSISVNGCPTCLDEIVVDRCGFGGGNTDGRYALDSPTAGVTASVGNGLITRNTTNPCNGPDVTAINVNTPPISFVYPVPNTFCNTRQYIRGIISPDPLNGCPRETTQEFLLNTICPGVTATPANQTVCSGAATGISLTTNTPATTLTWSASVSGGATGFANGTGTFINQNLVNNTSANSTVTYSITATEGTCSTVTTARVVVRPQVGITNPQEYCNIQGTQYDVSFAVRGTAPIVVTWNGGGPVTVTGTFTSPQFNALSARSFTVTDANSATCGVTVYNSTGNCNSPSNCTAVGCLGNNLIPDGTFESNVTVTSDYLNDQSCPPATSPCTSSSGQPILCQYRYFVGPQPSACNPDWGVGLQDHTPGTGNVNMMIVDFPAGSPAGDRIWYRTFNLQPNTNYCFSSWFVNLLSASGAPQPLPAFRFTANGVNIGQTPQLPQNELWRQFGFQFNSGAGGPVELAIRHSVTGNVGFDLAMDDLELHEILSGNPPAPVADIRTQCGRAPITIDVTANDVPGTNAINRNSVRVRVAPLPIQGTATDDGAGNIIFTPAANFSGTASLEYQVADVNGCIGTGTVDVTINPTPNAIVTPATATVCQGTDVRLTASGGVDYLWATPASINPSVTVTSSGTYVVTVISAANCSATASSSVTVNSTPSVTVEASPAIICEGQLSSVSATFSGGTAPLTFAWNAGLPANEGPHTVRPILGNNYAVTVTDVNGCTASNNASITVNALPQISVSATNATCSGLCNGSATVTIVGVTNPSIQWYDLRGIPLANATATSVSGLCPYLGAVAYTVVVTDVNGNGCSATGAFDILEDATIVVNTSVTDASCGNNNGRIELSVSGGAPNYTYVWSANATTGNVATALNLTGGTYDVSVNDANGCQQSVTMVVNSTSNLIVSATASPATCGLTNGAISITPSGQTYVWDNAAASGSNPTNLAGGTYRVTVTNSTGCTGTVSVTVSSTPAPSPVNISSNGGNQLTCGTPSITLTASGSNNYTWDDNSTGITRSVSASGLFAVTGSDANGCTAPASIQITSDFVAPNITATATAASLTCGITQVTLTAGGNGSSYNWGNGSDFYIINTPGTYTVTGSNPNLCTVTETVVVGQNITPPSAQISPSSASINCITGSQILTASGGGTYLWQDGSTSATFNAVAGGTYIVTVTDAVNACTASASRVVTDTRINITLTDNQRQPTCSYTNDGGITLTPSPAGFYTYSWTGVTVTGNNRTGLGNGTYSVLVTETSTGCSITGSYTLNRPSIAYSSIVPRIASCGQSNGSIKINGVVGGQPPYRYNFGNGSGTILSDSIGNLAPNTYSVSIIDALGCNANGGVVVPGTPNIIAATTPPVNTVCANSNGSVGVSVTNPQGVVSYVWSSNTTIVNTTTTQATGLPAGTYAVTVTDGNGCTFVNNNMVVGASNGLSLTNTATPPTCAGGNNGFIVTTVTGNSGPVTYLWSNGATSSDLNNITAGIYNVTASDASLGCTNTFNILVNDGTLVTVAVSPDVTISAGQSAILTATGTPLSASYAWSASGFTAAGPLVNVTPTTTTDYTVIASAGPCTATDVVRVNVIVERGVVMPNVFTPNGDGLNSVFQPVIIATGAVTITEFKIFNRWGEVVYKNEDGRNAWDGSYRGEQQAQDVYVYVVTAKYIDGREEKLQGDFVLMR